MKQMLKLFFLYYWWGLKEWFLSKVNAVRYKQEEATYYTPDFEEAWKKFCDVSNRDDFTGKPLMTKDEYLCYYNAKKYNFGGFMREKSDEAKKKVIDAATAEGAKEEFLENFKKKYHTPMFPNSYNPPEIDTTEAEIIYDCKYGIAQKKLEEMTDEMKDAKSKRSIIPHVCMDAVLSDMAKEAI